MQALPLTPGFGAEVSGADLTSVSDQQFGELEELFARHAVLFFRDQPELSPQQQVAFARRFGDLHTHPAAPTLAEHPEIFVIHAHAGSKVANGNGWHSDVSCDRQPPMATCLQLHLLPVSGGDTLFADMYGAFATLSHPLQQMLLGMYAHHESEHIYRGRYSDRGVDDADRIYPSALHPIVRQHPVTGRSALYVNPSFTTRIEGLPPAESEAILRLLYAHQQRPELQLRFKWSQNAIALWDNRCTQHFALWDYWPNERKGHRVTILGEEPIPATSAAERPSMRLSRQTL